MKSSHNPTGRSKNTDASAQEINTPDGAFAAANGVQCLDISLCIPGAGRYHRLPRTSLACVVSPFIAGGHVSRSFAAWNIFWSLDLLLIHDLHWVSRAVTSSAAIALLHDEQVMIALNFGKWKV